ncbi:hypothetical protein AB0K93_13290 [Streptomyces sp. NPDC052676]|uniref:hypothetical protein n=1 Tax=Streptomyces sp. NPDC052676 TaxID=3154953 RepID=UPI00342DE859
MRDRAAEPGAGGEQQTLAAVREPLMRAATPLMRCSNPAVVTATERLLKRPG